MHRLKRDTREAALVAELGRALATINRLGSKARRLNQTAQRTLHAGSFFVAAKLFREIAALLNGQALATGCAAAGSVCAAAYCELRAGKDDSRRRHGTRRGATSSRARSRS